MKTADEMFEELGYRIFEGLYEISYQCKEGTINFNKIHNIIVVYKNEEEDFIAMDELQAINKKCQELGWI